MKCFKHLILLSLLIPSLVFSQGISRYNQTSTALGSGETFLFAENTKGYDVLGVAMYCNEFLKAPKLPAMSTLMNTFGNPIPCIKKRIKQGGLKKLQVDLIDATCWRNNKCPPGVPRPDDLATIKKRSKQIYKKICKNNPDLECWLSPGLEHDVKNQATVKKMLDATVEGCPSCKPMNSPFTGAKPPGYKLELHGTKVKSFSVSGDGASIFDGDTLSNDGNSFTHQDSGDDQTYGWINEFNLRCTGEDSFTPPLKRTNKPTSDLFRQVYLNMQPSQEKPSEKPEQCQEVVDINSPEIHKPNAESYCNGQKDDGRGNKPLLIIKKAGKRGDKLPIYTTKGKEIGCYGYFGTYNQIKGAHRWYVGSCSKQTPTKLYDLAGGEWVYVGLGNKKCLRVNIIRRMGTYRS